MQKIKYEFLINWNKVKKSNAKTRIKQKNNKQARINPDQTYGGTTIPVKDPSFVQMTGENITVC